MPAELMNENILTRHDRFAWFGHRNAFPSRPFQASQPPRVRPRQALGLCREPYKTLYFP